MDDTARDILEDSKEDSDGNISFSCDVLPETAIVWNLLEFFLIIILSVFGGLDDSHI